MTGLPRATCPMAEPSHHFLILVQGKMRGSCVGPDVHAQAALQSWALSISTALQLWNLLILPAGFGLCNAIVVESFPCLLPDPVSIFLCRNFLIEDTFLIHHLPYPSWCSQNTLFLPLSRTCFQLKECSERHPFS